MEGTEGCFLSEINLTEKDNSSVISLICEIQKKNPLSHRKREQIVGYQRKGLADGGNGAKWSEGKNLQL